jgi:ribonuclease HI
MNNNAKTIQHLRIRQQNANKSITATADMLAKASPDKYDIIAIQEPYIDFLGNARATPNWYAIYPRTHYLEKEKKTRSMLLVNKRIATNAWEALDVGSPDVTAVKLKTQAGDIVVLNMYCDCTHSDALRDTKSFLQRQMESEGDRERDAGMIWLGDFNRHHPQWDEGRNNHLFTRSNLDEAQILIEATVERDMQMALPKDIPTLQAMSTGNTTRTDNVFLSSSLIECLLRCHTVPEDQPAKSDHFPIDTMIETTVEAAETKPRHNYRLVDWKIFNKKLEARLREQIEQPCPTDKPHFYRNLKELTDAITDTANEQVPTTKPSPFMKRWWSLTLTKLRAETRRAGRQAYKHRTSRAHESHAKYKAARNKYAEAIEKSKKEHWEDFLEHVNQKTVWSAHKYASADPSDGGRTRIPKLTCKHSSGEEWAAESNEEKADMLFKTFFPETATNPDETPSDESYPPPAFDYEEISDGQIRRAIEKLNAFKAPGANGIPNAVIKQCADVLLPYTGPLFRATFRLEVYPSEWRDSITKVLRKPGKKDYTGPGAYRPIALLDTLGKVLSACVAEDIVKNTERYSLLPSNHYGCRPGRTTTDAIHHVVATAKDAWRKGKVLGVLFLDIKGAFPSIILTRLIHNMRLRGIPQEYTEWIRRKVQGRRTTLHLDDYCTALMAIERGMDQGCPLSAIAYQFYNAGLIEIAHRTSGEDCVGFVDDTTVTAEGLDLHDAFAKLERVMTRAGGALEWADTHECTFAVEKFGLMGLTRRRERDPTKDKKTRPLTRPSINIGRHVVKPTESHKFLGVIIDQELRFKEQVNYALQKGSKFVEQYRRLAKPSRGVPARHMRQYYLAVAVPKLLYAADIFLVPGTARSKGTKGHINKLARVQRQAALAITGAMRTTASDILDAHANLLPFQLLVDKVVHRAAVRLACLPSKHPLAARVHRAATRYVKKHRTPIHEIMHAYTLEPHMMEKIETVVRGPKWEPAFKIRVPQKEEVAIAELRNDTAQVKVFSDGSCIDGGVGAAAVLYRGGEEVQAVRLYLGTEEEHTVFEAELVGMAMGAKLLNMERSAKYTIGTDSQAAMLTTRREKQVSAQYLVDAVHRQIEGVVATRMGAEVTVRWTPGHKGIRGNERADEEAKKAARGDSSEERYVPIECRGILPRSKATELQRHHKALKHRAKETFARSPRAQVAHKIDQTMPSVAFARLVAGMARRQAALLVQIRTGHVALNKHLFKIGKADSPTCAACRGADETVHHFLFRCPAYRTQREGLKQTLRRGATAVNTLLAKPKAMKGLFKYIQGTGRFKEIYGNVDMRDG